MWQGFNRFSFVSIFLIIAFNCFSSNDTTSYNPLFRDSVLKNNFDSSRWNKLVNALDIHKITGKTVVIQKQKNSSKSLIFLYIAVSIAFVLLLLRLVFDDFAFSMLEGMMSTKQFLIFYKSKKFDSLFAILSVYVLKITILSLLVYIGLRYMQKEDFTAFSFTFLLYIWLLLGVFFTAKNLLEFIFNWVIDTQDTFRAFFLQNLFAEFIMSALVLFLFLIYIYNSNVSYDFMFLLLFFSFVFYIVFNIVRSYQLMSNTRIPYKLHFFLYICTFKILPLLILGKYILNNIV